MKNVHFNCGFLLPCWTPSSSATSSKIGHGPSPALVAIAGMHCVLLPDDSTHLARPPTFSHCQTSQSDNQRASLVCAVKLEEVLLSFLKTSTVFLQSSTPLTNDSGTKGLKHYQFIHLHPSSMRQTISIEQEIYSTSTTYFTKTHG